MDTISIRNVRRFIEPYTARIAPITLLVGENSTGKTTFLAVFRLAWDIFFGSKAPDFNDEPFFLGGYDQIANYRGGRGGRAKFFHVQCTISLEKHPNERSSPNVPRQIQLSSTFVQGGSQPILQTASFVASPYRLVANFDGDGKIYAIDIDTPSWKGTVDAEEFPRYFISDYSGLTRIWPEFLYYLFRIRTFGRPGKKKKTISSGDLQRLEELFTFAQAKHPDRPYAIAPIRTKPARTYDPVKDTPSSEGGHVPMVLAKSYFDTKTDWRALKESLDKFGQSSGLFDEIGVKRLGRTGSDPFQLQIKISGPSQNLIDVGYGVSQVLPILVDTIRGKENQTFLLQQPEVHLHPRGQAELGSFICTLAKKHKQRFIIETHSDYIIDRIRADLREKRNGLSPDDVSILFFERDDGQIHIHNIMIDAEGNVVDAPEPYRQFFLEEERRFFGLQVVG